MKQISHFDSVIENVKAPLESFKNNYYCDKRSKFITQCILFTGLGYLGFYKEIESFPNVNVVPLAFYAAAGVISAFCTSKNDFAKAAGKALAATALATCCLSFLLASQLDVASDIYRLLPTFAETLPTLARIGSASLTYTISEKALSAFEL